MPRKAAKRRTMTPGGMIAVALALVVITALARYVVVDVLGYASSRAWTVTDTLKGVDYDFSSGAVFYGHDTRFFYFCTKDGMRYVGSDGRAAWQEMFNFTRPILTAHGDKVAVSEEKGRQAYVFGSGGLLYKVMLDDPILHFAVNQNGYLSAALGLDTGYAVHIYNAQNTTYPLYENIIHDPTLTPTATGVSPDGRYTLIALLEYGTRLNTKLQFYYTNANDAFGTPDGNFSSFDYENQLLHTIRFIADDRVLVVSDTRIDGYQLGGGGALHTPLLLWSIPLHNKLSQLAFYGDSRFAFVTGDKLLNDPEAAEPGEVHLYTTDGGLTGTFSLGRRATYLSMGHGHAIVGGDRRFYILDANGRQVWDYQTLYDTRGFIFLENTDTALIAGSTRASVMKRERP